MKNILRVQDGKEIEPMKGEKSRADVMRSVSAPTVVLIDSPSLVVIGEVDDKMFAAGLEVWA
jgi:hypothetical protein